MKCNVLGLNKAAKLRHIPKKGVCLFMLQRLIEWEDKKWRLYLYYNGILVKKIRIHENEAPSQNSYVVRIWGKKHLFGSNVATVILRPVELLKNDEKNQKTHWGAIYERGVEV